MVLDVRLVFIDSYNFCSSSMHGAINFHRAVLHEFILSRGKRANTIDNGLVNQPHNKRRNYGLSKRSRGRSSSRLLDNVMVEWIRVNIFHRSVGSLPEGSSKNGDRYSGGRAVV